MRKAAKIRTLSDQKYIFTYMMPNQSILCSFDPCQNQTFNSILNHGFRSSTSAQSVVIQTELMHSTNNNSVCLVFFFFLLFWPELLQSRNSSHMDALKCYIPKSQGDHTVCTTCTTVGAIHAYLASSLILFHSCGNSSRLHVLLRVFL